MLVSSVLSKAELTKTKLPNSASDTVLPSSTQESTKKQASPKPVLMLPRFSGSSL